MKCIGSDREKCVQSSGPAAGAWPPLSEDLSRSSVPRILDIRLAEFLGFDQPEDIRRLISKHEASLSQLGELVRQEHAANRAAGFYLNTKQAAFVSAKADTPLSAEITLNMVKTFVS